MRIWISQRHKRIKRYIRILKWFLNKSNIFNFKNVEFGDIQKSLPKVEKTVTNKPKDGITVVQP